jgi:aminopeptidase N
MKKLLLLVFILSVEIIIAQSISTDWKTNYQSTAPKINTLVHTKLNASFNYAASQLDGKVWLTLKPHFYPTDSLRLDAKGMDIFKVELVNSTKNISLKYTYDGKFINIKLNKTYTSKELYTIYIDYIAKPNELEAKGSAVITEAKGLYFINPLGKEKNKPTQIWTQGETEANSVWIPTIDKPNQKCTQEFNLTVPSKYVSLSNGKLLKQTTNSNNTRTDTWVMDLPHAPYLFFIGVGDYAIIKDNYKGKEVNYYLEQAFAPVGRAIFGNTPAMMQFYSEKLGIEYPWTKYSQIVGRDYVSGAMENTTATLHQESAQQDARQLTDGNEWESTIAHELFHQWFGDYVTAESWSNLTVNESFANYSELLWSEYKYGNDAAGYDQLKDMTTYLSSRSAPSKDLVRFFYNDKEDMFDLVSYQKGGRILHMLRKYVGDIAFYSSLNKYLTDNKFSNGSAHKLRMAFESVTGKDLNWFFNQWYFKSGHPKLDIKYGYDSTNKLAIVYIKQTQGGINFQLPISIDVYQGATKNNNTVWLKSKSDSFYFPAASKPELINVDGENILLAEKKDYKKIKEYYHQIKYGNSYTDRANAIDYALQEIDDPMAMQIIKMGLDDPFYRIRIKALNSLEQKSLDASTIEKVELLAKKDSYKLVRADAIAVLGKQQNPLYKSFFINAIKDSSYSVAGAALEALSTIDSATAYSTALKLSKEIIKGRLNSAVSSVITAFGDENAYDFITSNFAKMPMSTDKVTAVFSLFELLDKVNDPVKFKYGVDLIARFRDEIPKESRSQTDPFINDFILKTLASSKEAKGLQDLADYAKGKIKN